MKRTIRSGYALTLVGLVLTGSCESSGGAEDGGLDGSSGDVGWPSGGRTNTVGTAGGGAGAVNNSGGMSGSDAGSSGEPGGGGASGADGGVIGLTGGSTGGPAGALGTGGIVLSELGGGGGGGASGSSAIGSGGDSGANLSGSGGDSGANLSGSGGDSGANLSGSGGDSGANLSGSGGDSGANPSGSGGDSGGGNLSASGGSSGLDDDDGGVDGDVDAASDDSSPDAADGEAGADSSVEVDGGNSGSPICLIPGRRYYIEFEGDFLTEVVNDCYSNPYAVASSSYSRTASGMLSFEQGGVNFSLSYGGIRFGDMPPVTATQSGFHADRISFECLPLEFWKLGRYTLDVDCATGVVRVSGSCAGGHAVCPRPETAGSFSGTAALWPCTQDPTPMVCPGLTPECRNGICECTPSETPITCSASSTPQFCNANHQWQDRAEGPCSGSSPVCTYGACGACGPNSKPPPCGADNTPQFCNANLQWERAAGPCSGSAPVCLDGACKSCVPNPTLTACSASNSPQFCNANGQWQDRAEGPCVAPTPVCSLGRCVASTGSHPSVTQVSGGCALFDNGGVKCWGANGAGQLGLGDTANRGDAPGEMGPSLPWVNLGTAQSAIKVSAAGSHACAALQNGQFKCWGNNEGYLLGVGDSLNRGDARNEMGDNLLPIDVGTSLPATAVFAGVDGTCALFDNSQLKCWGADHGNLFLALPPWNPSPLDRHGNLTTVDLGTGRTAATVALGSRHHCALLDNGHVKCWGANASGQLGLGDTVGLNEWGIRFDYELGDSLPEVNLGAGRTATAIAVGGSSSCAVLDNGQVKCWGDNTAGQLGLGDTSNRGDQPGEMGDNLPAVDLGTGRTAKAVSLSAIGDFSPVGEHACAILDNGQVKCWGTNSAGQLGLGDTANRGDQPGEMGDNLPAVDLGTGRTATTISVEADFACAILDNGQVKCWGANAAGKLGLGDTASRGDQPGEMGDNLPAVQLW